MKWLFLILSFRISLGAEFTKNNFTFTYEMASRCKEHLCQSGYSYDTYYSIQHTKDADGVLKMHIAIQARSNGHILLSTMPFPGLQDPVYEIVVGGGSNKFTELRRNLKRNAKSSRPTPNILSAIELRGFYITIQEKLSGGLIEFGQEGSDEAIISYYDLDLLNIQYFSFAAWNGVEAKFLYDCPSPGDTGANAVPENSKTIERNLSNSEQLKKELLQDRQPNIPPGVPVHVYLESKVTSVSFNAFEAKLTTRMSLLSAWTDESLAWNPDKYQGLSNVTYRQGQIWMPVFHVYNADNLNSLKTIGYEPILMTSSGAARFHFKATVQTWCFTESEIYNRWPRDEYSCSIVIQPWEAHEQITLASLKDKENLLESLTDDDVVENEWQVKEMSQFTVSADSWNRMYPTQLNDTNLSDRMVITVTLQRRPANYNFAFYTPLLVLVTFVLLSFWSKPLEMTRVWFYAGCTIFICMGMCFMDNLVPCHTVPTILILYLTVLGGVLVALMLQVMMMTSTAEKLCKTTPVHNLLCAQWFRGLFCLPMKKDSYNRVNEAFMTQDDDDPTSVFTANGNIEEMQSDTEKYSEREELAGVLDKTMFFVYSVVFAAMMAAHY